MSLLQASPDKFNYSTSGFGSLPHLAGEMFKQMAKVEMTHVPYPGNSPATTAAVSGVVQITFDTPISSLPHVQAGTLRALAVASGEPIDVFAGDRRATSATLSDRPCSGHSFCTTREPADSRCLAYRPRR
jgi:tripartite-type tricarboxylate transporter receptor subunit TctC